MLKFANQIVGLSPGQQGTGGTAPVWADLNGSNQIETRRLYLNAIDGVFARLGSDGGVAWCLSDHLGSLRGLMNNSGTLIDTLAYDAYGNSTSESSPSNGDRFKFAGGQFDALTGLELFGRRWYSPADGIWVSQDPLGLLSDSNPYRYVRNEPINAIDLLGLDSVTLSIRGVREVGLSKKRVTDWGLNVTLHGSFKDGKWVKSTEKLEAYGKGSDVVRTYAIKEKLVNQNLQSLDITIDKEQRFLVIVDSKEGPEEKENPIPGAKDKILVGKVSFTVVEFIRGDFNVRATLLKGGTIDYDYKMKLKSKLEGRITLTLGEKEQFTGEGALAGNPPVNSGPLSGLDYKEPILLKFPKGYLPTGFNEQLVISWKKND